LFNMMRNLGGSLGIAMLATLLKNREQFHSNRIGESISLFDPETQQRIDQLTQTFVSRGSDLVTAKSQAIATLDSIVRREAFVMAFNDCFYFIGVALLLSGIAIIFFRKSKGSGAAVAH
jgi:MFS transporter, DHA2 family, multidrug resistance protein